MKPHSRLVVALCLVTALGAGCSASGSSTGTTKSSATTSTVPASQQPAPAGTYAVGRASRTYVDHHRSTEAHGGRPEKPERTLDTLILYPSGRASGRHMAAPVVGAAPLAGPWPVILFGHGSTTAPSEYLGKLSWWASAGYVVVAPAFPLSKKNTPGGTAYDDYPNQTRDESFVIDSISSDDTAPLHLESLIDPHEVGLGGQSFGAITALGTLASACCADRRIKAATTFAAAWLPYPSKNALAPWASKVPLLAIHGSKDPTLPYANDHAFWQRLGAPGGFLTLVGSGHDPGFFGGDGTALDTLVSKATLAFYDRYLKHGPDATPIIEKLVTKAGPKVATFEPSRS